MFAAVSPMTANGVEDFVWSQGKTSCCPPGQTWTFGKER